MRLVFISTRFTPYLLRAPHLPLTSPPPFFASLSTSSCNFSPLYNAACLGQ